MISSSDLLLPGAET